MNTPELILKRGLIYDGGGEAPFAGDIAISGTTIAAVSPDLDLKGLDEIDCQGMAVAPGFIDTHSHSDIRVLLEPGLPMKLRQGITLEIFGQDGLSVAPVLRADRQQVTDQLAGLNGRLDRDWDWETVGEYLAAIQRARPSVDCAYLIPHGQVRLFAMGMEDRRATAAEIAAMQQSIRDGMRQGALGLSTGLIYPPCCYADTAELIELARAVGEFDGVFVAHMRSESDYIEDSVAEMIEIGRSAGVRTHISHFKIAGRENFARLEAVLEMIAAARASGLRLTADQYPYVAGSTMLGAILPPWAHAGGVAGTLERLKSQEERGRMRSQMLDTGPSQWDNFWKWSGPEGIVISDIASSGHPEYVGKNLADAAALARNADRVAPETAVDFAFDLLSEERMGVGMISFSQSETVVSRIMQEPYVNVCTDGLLGGKPHPRAYGTYPRILGRYVREQGILSLAQAVRKMSGLAAATFQLRDHGRIEAGARANLVVFDPETVADRATFEESRQYPVGIRDVIVGGTVAVRNHDSGSQGSGVAVRRTSG